MVNIINGNSSYVPNTFLGSGGNDDKINTIPALRSLLSGENRHWIINFTISYFKLGYMLWIAKYKVHFGGPDQGQKGIIA